MKKQQEEIKIITKLNKFQLNTPTEITNLTRLENEIVNIKEVNELIMPSIIIDKLKKAFKKENSKLEEAIKIEVNKASIIKKKIESLIQEIKWKALSTVKVETKTTQNKDGVIKTKTTHDLPTEIFSYTPSKKGVQIDTYEILKNPEKYKKFLKEKISYELDMDKISNAKSEELPWIEKNSEVRISFKSLDTKKMNNLLGVKDE